MSYRLDAADERIFHGGTLPDPATTGLTIMGWFRIRVDREDFSTYWRTSSSGATIHTVATHIGGTSTNVFTTSGSIENTYANVVDEWVHIAVVDNAGTVTQYVTPGGGTIVSKSGTVGTGTPGQVCIGGRDSGTVTEWMNGAAAHVRVFASALTQTQVETERDSATAVVSAWADWPLSTGTDLADTSGNGRNLTAVASGATTEEDPPIPESSNEGTLAATGLLPTASIEGSATSAGTLAATALPPTASASADVRNAGALDTSPGLASASLSASLTADGSIDATALLPTVVITTAGLVTGTLAAQAPLPTASAQGGISITGQLDATAPLSAAALAAAGEVSRGQITPVHRTTSGITPIHRTVATISGGVRP